MTVLRLEDKFSYFESLCLHPLLDTILISKVLDQYDLGLEEAS